MDYSCYAQAQEVDHDHDHHHHHHRQNFEQQQQPHSYNPYQYQIYDSSQPYYAYQPPPPPPEQQLQYPYNYPHHYYANPYSQLHYDSTQPPGVPLPPENGVVAHRGDSDRGLNSGFDPPPVTVPRPPKVSGNFPIGHSPCRGGTRGNGLVRGGGRPHFGHQVNGPSPSSSRGRGCGHGTLPKIPSSTAPPQRQPQPAFCTLYRVDCNSLDMFEKHINGKKHKHKLQRLNQSEPDRNSNVEEQNALMPEKPDEGNQTPVVSEPPMTDSGISSDTERGMNCEVLVGELERSHRQNSGEVVAVPGGKRKTRSCGQGRRRKTLMRGGNDSQAPKPANILYSCELCKVKCDTQAVLNIHLVGKKHQLSLKRFHSNNPSSNNSYQLPALLRNSNDPQLVLAQILMAYMLSQTVSNPSALTEGVRNQLQSLLSMSNRAANKPPDHGFAATSLAVPKEN